MSDRPTPDDFDFERLLRRLKVLRSAAWTRAQNGRGWWKRPRPHVGYSAASDRFNHAKFERDFLHAGPTRRRPGSR